MAPRGWMSNYINPLEPPRTKNLRWTYYRILIQRIAEDIFGKVRYGPIWKIRYEEVGNTPHLLIIFRPWEFSQESDQLGILRSKIREHWHLGYFHINIGARRHPGIRRTLLFADPLYTSTPPIIPADPGFFEVEEEEPYPFDGTVSEKELLDWTYWRNV
ncbi:hypothetical protein Daesc_003895 [Daldinia eschscholtzii]|uniref:Uncharacterized protein n=1 Tax=Daldinia eschscholtzii TaxID=292717 RepID=A0AAX6MNA4_9PEZI